MDLLSDESLMEVYEAAKLNNLNKEFLKLIIKELKRRNIRLPASSNS